MIRRWVKLLPYFIVMKIIKKVVPRSAKVDGILMDAWRVDDVLICKLKEFEP